MVLKFNNVLFIWFILSLILIICFSESIQLNLNEGWNLISIPFRNYIIRFNDCEIKVIYSYENGKWKKIDINNLEIGKGYWIRVTNSCSLILKGEEETKFELNIVKGWNLVGFPFDILVKDLLEKYGNRITRIYSFENGKWKILNRSDRLEIGKGYWIYVTSSFKLIEERKIQEEVEEVQPLFGTSVPSISQEFLDFINSKDFAILPEEFRNSLKLIANELQNIQNTIQSISDRLKNIIEKYKPEEEITKLEELLREIKNVNSTLNNLLKKIDELSNRVGDLYKKTDSQTEKRIIARVIYYLEITIRKYLTTLIYHCNSLTNQIQSRINDLRKIAGPCNIECDPIPSQATVGQTISIRCKCSNCNEKYIGYVLSPTNER
ncbi:MAG: hypothetical protein QW678_01780, partial [Candidatus Aenigmatarchaeota archaeon]